MVKVVDGAKGGMRESVIVVVLDCYALLWSVVLAERRDRMIDDKDIRRVTT